MYDLVKSPKGWLFSSMLALACTLSANAQQPAANDATKALPSRLVEAEPNAGFHHPYLMLIPATLKANSPIVVTLPTPPTSEDSADFLAAAERIAANASPFLEPLQSAVVVPVLPRPPLEAPEGTTNLYLPALTRASLVIREASLARIDRQVLAMVEDARRRVANERGVEVHGRAFFVGFSAAGHFATRMAVLHPERVLGVWAGGTGGHPIVPLDELEGHSLTYPVGVADLEQLTGHPFDREAFARVPMLIAQGTADRNSSLPSGEAPSDSYSREQARLVAELFGKTASERLERVKAVYETAGCRAEFRLYEGVEHRISPEMARDIVEFIREHSRLE